MCSGKKCQCVALYGLFSDRFIPLYGQLQHMKLSQSPFVLLSVIGQELLSDACYDSSVAVLESALRIGELVVL